MGQGRIRPVGEETCRSLWCDYRFRAIGEGGEYGTKDYHVSEGMGR